MIGKIFLGKAWHWAVLVAAAGLLWYCGSNRLHVIEFNLFIITMTVATAGALLTIIWIHRDDEQVTREALHHQEFDAQSITVPPKE